MDIAGWLFVLAVVVMVTLITKYLHRPDYWDTPEDDDDGCWDIPLHDDEEEL